MRGIDVFMNSLVLHDVDTMFGNPGTTENPLLDNLIDYPDFNYYVTLHEGIAVGAAGFYAQATGKTGLVNLHVAPGLGNAIGMMYGAMKSKSPMIVTAGQQDLRMRLRDPLLSHDLVSMAAPVTKWSAEPRSADEVSEVMRRAFQIANQEPKGPVFVALPINVMTQETELAAVGPGNFAQAHEAEAKGIEQVVEMLLKSANPAIVVGDDVAVTGSVTLMVSLAEKIGAHVYHEGLRAQNAFPGRDVHNQGRIPFEAAGLRGMLAPHDLILMTDGPEFQEVWFDHGGLMPEDAVTVQLCASATKAAYKFPVTLSVLGSLNSSLSRILAGIESSASAAYQKAVVGRNELLAGKYQVSTADAEARLKSEWDLQPMSPMRAIAEISSAIPAGTIVVDESITASTEIAAGFEFAKAGDYFGGRGGGIGQGIAGALGVKVGHMERPVLCTSGDGSAMYSIQALWTAAHHDLAIVFVIFSNKEYRVLKHNLDIYRKRFDQASNRPYPHMDLTQPIIGFTDMAKGMGLASESVEKADDLAAAIKRGFDSGKPYLIEVAVSGKQ
ncbi:MAG: benzoylformate decarboxylase [Candidatus Azotimanducaceae bacterium]|jgi:benzoylformate decarboxylase